MKTKLCITVLFIALGAYLYGQEQVWTLEECINYALERNISINQKKLSNQINEVNLKQDKAGRAPSVNASGSQSFNFGRSVDPYTNIYTSSNFASNNFAVNANWTLFSGLQNKNTIEKTKIEIQSGSLDLKETQNNITISVSQAYLQILYVYEQVEDARNKLISTQAQVKRTESLFRAGEVPEGTLFQINAQEASDQYSLVNYQNQLEMAKISLMQYMELPVDEESLFDVVQPEYNDSLLAFTILQDSQEIFENAKNILPEIESAELKIASAEQSLKIAKGANYPRLSLSAGLNSGYSNNRNLYERETTTEERQIGYLQSDPTELVMAQQNISSITNLNYPFGQQVTDNFSQSVRLNLSIPIYSNRQVKSNVERSKINIQTAQLNAQNTNNQLRKKIEQAYNDMIAAAKNHEAAKEQVKNLKRSYGDSERKFELGMINATDFIVEQNQYFDSESNLNRAKYQFIFTQKILDFYQGKPITL
ncbi:MAG: TolC family protein [Bacteroidales bacterium]|nr:TolC family protein [Bacteroidales bacterium]